MIPWWFDCYLSSEASHSWTTGRDIWPLIKFWYSPSTLLSCNLWLQWPNIWHRSWHRCITCSYVTYLICIFIYCVPEKIKTKKFYFLDEFPASELLNFLHGCHVNFVVLGNNVVESSFQLDVLLCQRHTNTTSCPLHQSHFLNSTHYGAVYDWGGFEFYHLPYSDTCVMTPSPHSILEVTQFITAMLTWFQFMSFYILPEMWLQVCRVSMT